MEVLHDWNRPNPTLLSTVFQMLLLSGWLDFLTLFPPAHYANVFYIRGYHDEPTDWSLLVVLNDPFDHCNRNPDSTGLLNTFLHDQME